VKGQTLGFSMQESTGLAYDTLKERVTGELKKVFRPELLNRVDEVIVFHDLAPEEIEAIVDLLVARVRDQLVTQGVGIRLTAAARTLLATSGFDPAMGARPLRRAIQRLVEDPLSEQLLGGEWLPGDTVLVDATDGTIVFRKGDTEELPPVQGKAAAASKATTTPRAPRARRGTGAAGGAAGA
jgi:ATP-dependent Clp protease ATP-binding subunit ClpC